ncbi:hypothetical protein JL721_9295 [Aureococcus anophagefferens]|nr:hypothetical protein JL721_9295 [Aureococcus anophagefferens]
MLRAAAATAAATAAACLTLLQRNYDATENEPLAPGGSVVVVGAGVVGVSTADELSRRGFRVTVLEASPGIAGAASATTATRARSGGVARRQRAPPPPDAPFETRHAFHATNKFVDASVLGDPWFYAWGLAMLKGLAAGRRRWRQRGARATKAAQRALIARSRVGFRGIRVDGSEGLYAPVQPLRGYSISASPRQAPWRRRLSRAPYSLRRRASTTPRKAQARKKGILEYLGLGGEKDATPPLSEAGSDEGDAYSESGRMEFDEFRQAVSMMGKVFTKEETDAFYREAMTFESDPKALGNSTERDDRGLLKRNTIQSTRKLLGEHLSQKGFVAFFEKYLTRTVDPKEAAEHFRALVEGAAEMVLRDGEEGGDGGDEDAIVNDELRQMKDTKHVPINKIVIYAKDLRKVMVAFSEKLTDEEADVFIRECKPKPLAGAQDGGLERVYFHQYLTMLKDDTVRRAPAPPRRLAFSTQDAATGSLDGGRASARSGSPARRRSGQPRAAGVGDVGENAARSAGGRRSPVVPWTKRRPGDSKNATAWAEKRFNVAST